MASSTAKESPTLGEIIDFLRPCQDHSIEDFIKDEADFEFFRSRMLPDISRTAELKANSPSNGGRSPRELSLIKKIQELASGSTTLKSTMTLEQTTITPKKPAAQESIETLDNHTAPTDTTTSGNIAPSENNTIPGDTNTLKITKSFNTATNVEHYTIPIPDYVERLSPSFQLWARSPISFWERQFSELNGRGASFESFFTMMKKSSQTNILQHRFTCVIAYLSFQCHFDMQRVTGAKVRQFLQMFDISAEHESSYTNLIQSGRKCVEFCQQLQPDRFDVDYGPLFRLDIPDNMLDRRNLHFQKKLKGFLDKLRSQNIARWSETSGARAAAKAIIEFFTALGEPVSNSAPKRQSDSMDKPKRQAFNSADNWQNSAAAGFERMIATSFSPRLPPISRETQITAATKPLAKRVPAPSSLQRAPQTKSARQEDPSTIVQQSQRSKTATDAISTNTVSAAGSVSCDEKINQVINHIISGDLDLADVQLEWNAFSQANR